MTKPKVGKWELGVFIVIIGAILAIIIGTIGFFHPTALTITANCIKIFLGFLLLVAFEIIPIKWKLPKTWVFALVLGIIITVLYGWYAGPVIIVGAILMVVLK
ncbi:MAG: hypothetical protein ACFFCS_09800 [Candidatus Hodarchaeota archaeon]